MKQIQLLLRNTYKISMDVVHFTSAMIMKARRETQASIFPACMFSNNSEKIKWGPSTPILLWMDIKWPWKLSEHLQREHLELCLVFMNILS